MPPAYWNAPSPTGVKLVVSDADVGLTKAIRRQLHGREWQR